MKKILTVMVLLGVFVSLSFSVAMAAEEAKGLDPALFYFGHSFGALIGMALIESLVIYSLVVSLLLFFKL